MRRLAAAAMSAAIVLAGCGSGDDEATTARSGVRLDERTRATLILDFLPNAVHAGVYRAVAAGYYEDNNVDLRIVRPTSTADTLKLIDAGRADVGLADSVDVMQQIDQGRDAQAIMAVVQRPLGGVITRRADRLDASRLAGRKVGISGVPSDRVILDTIVRDAGVSPDDVETVTIGVNGEQNLVSKTVDAFVGYYPADGAQAEAAGTPVRSLAFDEHGGPRYPGLVAFSTRKRIGEREGLVRAIVDATVRGYEDVIAAPEAGLADLVDQNPELDRKLSRAQLDAYVPLLKADAPRFGVIRSRDVAALSAFLVRSGLIDRQVPASRFATDRLLPPQ